MGFSFLNPSFFDRLQKGMLPPKQPFDLATFKTAFPESLDAYMEVQRHQQTGRFAEKTTLINNLKEAAKDLSTVQAKQRLQGLLERGAEDLTSRWFYKATAGSTVLNAWLEKLNEDPELQEISKQKPRLAPSTPVSYCSHF